MHGVISNLITIKGHVSADLIIYAINVAYSLNFSHNSETFPKTNLIKSTQYLSILDADSRSLKIIFQWISNEYFSIIDKILIDAY